MPPPEESTRRESNNTNQSQQREYREHTRPAPAFFYKPSSLSPRPVKINYNSLPHWLDPR
jgi:hypothetical protein